MWVRLWCHSTVSSGLDSNDTDYQWFDKRPSDEALKSYAEEFGDKCYGYSERGFRYGFDRLKRLPIKVRKALVAQYKEQISQARKMIKIIER